MEKPIINQVFLSQKLPLFASDKLWTCLTGLSFFLAVQAYPLGMGLTTTRLAILLSAAQLFWRFTLNFSSTFPTSIYIPIYASLVAFLVSAISFLINGGSLWDSTSWLFLGFLSSFIALCVYYVNQENIELFIKTVLICTVSLWLATLGDLVKLSLFSAGGSALRRWYTENSLNDLNRSMNTMFVYSAILIGAVYFSIIEQLKWKIVSCIIIIMSLIMFILTGSRQNLIAAILYFCLIGVISLNKRKLISSMAKYIGRFIVAVSSFIIVLYLGIRNNLVDYIWIQQRFFPFFLEQQMTTGDELRVSLAENAYNCSLNNSGFGVGPGNVLGAHNGYLCYLGENGIFLGVISIAIIFMLIFATMLKSKIKNNPIRIVTWAGFLVVALFLTNVKDLFREPLYWSLLGVSIGFTARKTKSGFLLDNKSS